MYECYAHDDRLLTRAARLIISICRARRPGADRAVRPTILILTDVSLRRTWCLSPRSFPDGDRRDLHRSRQNRRRH